LYIVLFKVIIYIMYVLIDIVFVVVIRVIFKEPLVMLYDLSVS